MNCPYKINGMYVLVTNGVVESDTEVVYGIRPAAWNALPLEGIALLKIRQAIPETGAALPVALAVPSSSTVSTVGEANACCTVTSLPFLNPLNVALTGADIVNNTERLLYFNKVKGLLRVLDGAAPAATGG